MTLNWAPLGGLEIYSMDLVAALRRAGCTVDVWSVFDQPGALPDDAEPLAPRGRLAIGLYCRFLWENLLRRRMAAVASEYNLAICGHVNMLPAVYQASIQVALPYWVWTYGIEVWADWSPEIRSGLEAAQCIGTISNHTKLSITTKLPDARVVVVPPAVDVAHFVPVQKMKNTDEPAILLTVGRLEPGRDKGHEVVMRSLPLIVRRAERSVLYLIAGAGSDRSRLKRLAHEYEVADWVEFLGRVPDQQLVQLYQSCDVFVMPSRGEGFGIVYAEAAACGKPIVGSNQGGAAEALVDGVTGFAVSPTSVDAVADACAKLLADPTLATRMGEAGRRFVVENFSLEAFEQRVAALLTESGLRTCLGQHQQVSLSHQEEAK